MVLNILAVSIGAAFGALLRWFTGLLLNQAPTWFPLGTLVVNWVGAYLIGLAAGFLGNSALPTQWKLFVITGFLGGLTTFSSFSLEVVQMLQTQRYAAAFSTVSLHVFGSLLLTIAGLATVSMLRG